MTLLDDYCKIRSDCTLMFKLYIETYVLTMSRQLTDDEKDRIRQARALISQAADSADKRKMEMESQLAKRMTFRYHASEGGADGKENKGDDE